MGNKWIFDVEKAYDTTWKYGIMKDIIWISGNAYHFLFITFYQNRKFQVRVGTYLSDLYDQEMEVPQGIILLWITHDDADTVHGGSQGQDRFDISGVLCRSAVQNKGSGGRWLRSLSLRLRAISTTFPPGEFSSTKYLHIYNAWPTSGYMARLYMALAFLLVWQSTSRRGMCFRRATSSATAMAIVGSLLAFVPLSCFGMKYGASVSKSRRFNEISLAVFLVFQLSGHEIIGVNPT